MLGDGTVVKIDASYERDLVRSPCVDKPALLMVTIHLVKAIPASLERTLPAVEEFVVLQGSQKMSPGLVRLDLRTAPK
jgi:hypothetical protein